MGSADESTSEEMRDALDRRLTEGLLGTFPASDPPAVTAPQRQTRVIDEKLTRQLRRRGFRGEARQP